MEDLIDIFVDETGTISSNKEKEPYGVGFITLLRESRKAVEEHLEEGNLTRAHFNKMNRGQKLDMAQWIGSSRLKSLGVVLGAVIRLNPNFASKTFEDEIYKSVSNSPELAVKKYSSFKKGRIVTASDLFSKEIGSARLQDTLLMASRFTMISAVTKWGVKNIRINLSAVGVARDHDEKIEVTKVILPKQLSHFLNEINKKRPDFGLTGDSSSKISVRVRESAKGVFALADFTAGISRLLSSEKKENVKFGEDLYNLVKELFPKQIFGEELERYPGIYFLP